MDAIELTLFTSRIQAICDEMGAILMRTALSPNIKDRRDFSCAVFDADGRLCAQAAHIPVHLGSMAYAMRDIVNHLDWQDGDMVMLNDPFLGGTHLPDVTLIAPVFQNHTLCAFVVNRAHHADIGASTPGSMPIARQLDEEGIVIPPTFLMRNNVICEATFSEILQRLHNPCMARADFSAQASSNLAAIRRMLPLIQTMGVYAYQNALSVLNNYAESLARAGLNAIPGGRYTFTDVMDDDGLGNFDIQITVSIDIARDNILIDFTGTADQVEGNINCPISVTAAAVYYCFYCLMPPHTPACDGSFRSLSLKVPAGSLVNAERPAAVTAGNVETSTRIVDVILGALAQALPDKIPAASHGSMNNIAMGADNWDYYETLGGGMGAGASGRGLNAIQTHMTNTFNTPIEVLEKIYPLRINRYAVRTNTGGRGHHCGGNGITREYEFLEDCCVTLLTERRRHPPWGLAGADSGIAGANYLNNQPIPGKTTISAHRGDRLIIKTAGGGGWGIPGNS